MTRSQHSTTVEKPIVIENASFYYGKKKVLSGVTGSLDAGHALALLGPNGSGKTTILNGLLGAVKSSGTVHVLGKRPGRAPHGSLGYVPQLTELDKMFPVRVIDVVAMGTYSQLGYFRRPGKKIQTLALQTLEKSGLAHRAKDRFGTLSGGQQQRVLLARCLISQPQIILLDEPFNGLDAPSRDNLLHTIAEVKEKGVSVVVSTHDLIIAREVCETIALLAGRQVAFGTKEEVLRDDLLEEAYGGTLVGLS